MHKKISNLSLAMHHAENCTPEEKEILLAFLTTNILPTTATTNANNQFTVAAFFKKLTDKHQSFAKKNIKRLQNQRKQLLVSKLS